MDALQLKSSTSILDLGCGTRLGWVPDFYLKYPFESYLGIDFEPLLAIQFYFLGADDPAPIGRISEDDVISATEDLGEKLAFWKSHRPSVSEDFLAEILSRIRVIPNTDLCRTSIAEIVGQEQFDLIVLSDILHLVEVGCRHRIIDEVRLVARDGARILVRYFHESGEYGHLTQDDIEYMDGLFGIPQVFASIGCPDHSTRLYSIPH